MTTQTLSQKPATSPLTNTSKRLKEAKTTASRRKTTSKAQTTKLSDNTSETVQKWVNMPREELDQIYKNAKSGTLPQGVTRGTAILGRGPLPGLFSKLARVLAWQGKVFDLFSPDFNSGVVVNKILPVGLNAIVAKTYQGESWMDGKDTIVIDYSDTSLLARPIRDEIREVEPGLYLGKVWWGKTRILDFALETHRSDKRH